MNFVDITRGSITRALTAAALRYDGLKLREIGKQLGNVTMETARQAVLKGERLLKRRYAALNACAEIIAAGILICPDCGAVIQGPDDRFCSQCHSRAHELESPFVNWYEDPPTGYQGDDPTSIWDDPSHRGN